MRCRRAQSQFDPLRRALTEQITYEAQPEKRPHGQYQQRHGHNGTDQEPAPEVDQLGVKPFVAARNAHGFQSHAAFRAIARRVADGFGMHRAGVLRSCRCWSGGLSGGLLVLACQVVHGVRGELVVALLRAKVPGLAVVFEARLARAKGDVHAADRILHGRCVGRVMVMVHAVRGVRILGLVMMVVPVQFGVRVHGSPLQVVLLPA